MDDDSTATRSVYTQDLIEISMQSNESLDMLLELIKDKAGKELSLRTHIFSILCELVWLNSRILLILKKDLQDLAFKSDDQKEVIVSKTTLDVLLTLIVSRAAATEELNTFSHSLSLH